MFVFNSPQPFSLLNLFAQHRHPYQILTNVYTVHQIKSSQLFAPDLQASGCSVHGPAKGYVPRPNYRLELHLM